jgi:hypothetical protein
MGPGQVSRVAYFLRCFICTTALSNISRSFISNSISSMRGRRYGLSWSCQRAEGEGVAGVTNFFILDLLVRREDGVG